MTIENNVREYARIRINTYIENMIPKQKISDKDALKLYDNCMEILSLIDYCFIELDMSMELKLITMQKAHDDQVKRLIKEGKIPMI